MIPHTGFLCNFTQPRVHLFYHICSVDVNKPTEAGETALYMAARKDHSEVVNLLLQHEQIDPNRGTTTNGDTPLVIATKRGKTESVRTLLYHPEIGNIRI